MKHQNIVLTGTGKYIPENRIRHEFFKDHNFYTKENLSIEMSGSDASKKLEEITGIYERRYASDGIVNSDMGYQASLQAIEKAGVSIEEIDQIIVAHNFGDVKKHSVQTDMVPSLAARIKHQLGIENPNCVAYDVVFGCPGWLQGVIQAYSFIKAGIAKTCLVVGTETLSRVVDVADRDSMIYADGAGAVVVQALEEDEPRGIINFKSQSYTKEEISFLHYGETFKPESKDATKYIKMHGRKIYEFALKKVPAAMKACYDESGLEIKDLKKIFIHQANEKMDEAIVKRFYRAYKMPEPEQIMPLSIPFLGNSSVATIPTLYDMVLNNEFENHSISKGDVVLFASVGAGMNINALTYIL